ncbi:MAG: hypothetical protein DI537_13655 [Stutzerimonas stutzeri]|nr:MAG: hypothetical protein DI537_13655 [Stutzerimonas stutzeri]
MIKNGDIKPHAAYEIAPDGRSKAPADEVGSNASEATPPVSQNFSQFDAMFATVVKPPSYDPYHGDDKFKRKLIKRGKHLLVVTCMKGGNGKSTTSSALVEACKHHRISSLAMEGDDLIRDFAAAYKADSDLRTLGLDILKDTGVDGLTQVMSTGISPIILNCPATSAAVLQSQRDAIAMAVEDHGYELTFLWPIAADELTLPALDDFMTAFPFATTHAVLNLKESEYGELSEFNAWRVSPVRLRLEKQGRALVMPCGPAELMAMRASKKVSFRELSQDRAYQTRPRAGLNGWLKTMRGQFGRVLDFEG